VRLREPLPEGGRAMRSTTCCVHRVSFSAGLLALIVVCFGAIPSSAQGYSHVRIVRLSFVEGTVTVQRPDMSDWATAPVNTPIQEGFKLSTASDSFAEVEFEKADSTARLGQQSLLEFSQLALAPDGGKVNRLNLYQGYATFHFVPADSDVYEVRVGDTTVTPYGKTEFRVDLDDGQVRLEVFKGSVEASGPEGSKTIAKDTVLELHPGEGFDIAQGITKDPWDQWVEERDQVESVAQLPAGAETYSAEVGSNLYGWNDLNGYGDWGFLPGYGDVWFPNVGLGWSPYSLGRWCWYPGFGWTWISTEPWGWLPFHYGGWFLDPAFGWYWMPFGFGVWSPALVTWYQGPGWVGWAPKPATPPTRIRIAGGTPPAVRNYCPTGRTCMSVVSTEVLRNGTTISPKDLMAVDLGAARGRAVPTPDIQPTRLSSLPGAPVSRTTTLVSGSAGAQTGATVTSSTSTRHVFSEGRAPSSASSTGLRATENSWGGFTARTGPLSGRGESSERVEGSTSGGRSGHIHFGGGSHSAAKASSGSSGGGSRGGGGSGGGGGHVGGGGSIGGGGGGGSVGGGGGGGRSGGGGTHH
jgi:uncharacterized protein DUF6600/FecR-like protein